MGVVFDEVVTQVETPPQSSPSGQQDEQQSGEKASAQQKAQAWRRRQATFWRRQQRLEAD